MSRTPPAGPRARKPAPAAGGLLNATFGNAAELIIALIVLSKGPRLYPLVKATITGSIIGNLLLVLGLSVLAGCGTRRSGSTGPPPGSGPPCWRSRPPGCSCRPCSSTY
jgi:hypothetical protein